MKKFLLVGLIVIALMVTFFCFRLRHKIFPLIQDLSPAKQHLYQNVRKEIHSIKIGMTTEEVKQIMKYPVDIVRSEFEGKSREIWYFPDSRDASEPSRCIFDENRKVIEVISGDEYYLKKESR